MEGEEIHVKVQKIISTNHRRKFVSPKEGDAYEGVRSIQNTQKIGQGKKFP